MLLSVAIRYFYCSRLCIIFVSHPTPLISSRSAISPPLPIILLGLILISMPPRWGNHPVLRHLNVPPPPPPPRFIYVSRFLNGGWRAVAHHQTLLFDERRGGEKIRQIRWRHLTRRLRLIGGERRKARLVERAQMRDTINPRTRRVSALLQADVPRPSLVVIVRGYILFFFFAPRTRQFQFRNPRKDIGRVYCCTGGVPSPRYRHAIPRIRARFRIPPLLLFAIYRNPPSPRNTCICACTTRVTPA